MNKVVITEKPWGCTHTHTHTLISLVHLGAKEEVESN